MGFTHIWFFANPDLQDRLRATNERKAAAAYNLFRRLGRWLAAARQALGTLRATRRRRREIAVTIRELNALDDDILHDIGIPRGAIRDVARGLATDEPVGPPANDAGVGERPALALVVDRPARPVPTAAGERQCA